MKTRDYDGTSDGIVAHEQRRGGSCALLMALLTVGSFLAAVVMAAGK